MDQFVNLIQTNNQDRENIILLNRIIQELNHNLEDMEQTEQQNNDYKPATQEFINSLEEIKIEKDNLSCSICLEEFQKGETCIKLPCPDPHYFHKNNENCSGIQTWLKKSNTCPICRTEFPCNETPRRQINIDDIDRRLENVFNGILQENTFRPPRHIRIFNPVRFIQQEEERQLQAAIQSSLENQ